MTIATTTAVNDPSTTDDTAPAASEEAIKDQAYRNALVTALAGAFSDYSKEMRAGLDARMLHEFNEHGHPSVVVHDPAGEKLVTFVVNQPTGSSGFRVTDDEALLEFCEMNHATEVETIVQIKPAFQAALLKRLVQLDDGTVVDQTTGLTVPGVEYKVTPPGPATSVTTKWAHTKDSKSKKQALQLALDGFLPDLVEAIAASAVAEVEG